ncbi:hypothetical protein BACFRA24663_16910 [Bacteroides fragilis]
MNLLPCIRYLPDANLLLVVFKQILKIYIKIDVSEKNLMVMTHKNGLNMTDIVHAYKYIFHGRSL